MPATLPEVEYEFQTSEKPHEWSVVRMHCTEALSELFELALEVATADDVVLDDLLETKATLKITRAAASRYLDGVVVSARDLGRTADQRVYELVVAPAMWLLSLRRDHRIFEEKKTLEVVTAVLQGSGVGLMLDGSAPTIVREYCVQWGESDLSFVRRLLEEDGVTFLFPPTQQGGKKVAVKHAQKGLDFEPFESYDGNPVAVMGQGGATADAETIRQFHPSARPVSDHVTLGDYDFTLADLSQFKEEGRTQRFPQYAFPGRFPFAKYPGGGTKYDAQDVRRLTVSQKGAIDATAKTVTASSNVSGLRPGVVISVLEEGEPAAKKYLVTRVMHRGEAPEVLYADQHTTDMDRYANQFECIPAESPWQPPRVTPRPHVASVQTGVVVDATKGLVPNTVVTDVHGRVRVQFFWDRNHKGKATTGWLRCAQLWAGARWGAQFIPRVGMEVVVQFVDGDPDRPLITGCVYNSVNKTPFELPKEALHSGIRTQTVEGEGFNELRFVDEAAKELVSLRAQKDLKVEVLHDATRLVKNNETVTVEVDATRTVNGKQTLTVKGDRTLELKAKETVSIHGNRKVTVRGTSEFRGFKTHKVDTDEGITLHTGGSSVEIVPDSITLKAQSKISLECSGNKVEITPQGVTLSSAAGAKVELQGPKVTVSGSALVEVSAPLVKIN